MFVTTVLTSLVIASCFAEEVADGKREAGALVKADSSELSPNDREGKCKKNNRMTKKLM